MSPVLGKKGEGQRSRGHREQWPPECIIDIRGYTAAGLLCLLNFEVDKSFARSYPGSSSPLPDFRSSRHDCALMNSITIGAGELKIWYNFFWMRCTLVRPHQARACSTARGEAELSCTTSDLRSHVPTVIHGICTVGIRYSKFLFQLPKAHATPPFVLVAACQR